MRAMLFLGIVLMAPCAFGVTVQLRNGATVAGSIVSTNDDTLVLSTATGERTFPWRELSNQSIQQIHPDLYARLKQQAIERAKAREQEMADKGLVKVGDKWVPKEEAMRLKYRHVRLRVARTERTGPAKEESSTESSRTYIQDCHGVLTLEFEGLDSKTEYHVKTEFKHYTKLEDEADRRRVAPPSATVRPATREETIKGQSHHRVDYESDPYQKYKVKMKADWVMLTDGGRRKRLSGGYESDGWDIKVWLDGNLVYEERKGDTPEFHIIEKL